MNRLLRWLIAVVGPVFLILVFYSVHLIGTGLHSQKINERLHQVLTERPLDPSILEDIDIAALVEPLSGTPQLKSAQQLLALGAMLERGAYDEFQKQLPRPDLKLPRATVEHWNGLTAKLTTPSETGIDQAALKQIRKELAEELTRRLTPPLSDFERDYYETVRVISAYAGYNLPELPRAQTLEMTTLQLPVSWRTARLC